jgi:hypothetical protein
MYDMREGEKVTRSLKCKLTPEEVAARGQELANQIGDRHQVELEKKAEADKFKAQIQEIDSRCTELATEIRDKAEWREGEVVAERDGDQMVLIRLDTGEVIQQRPLKDSERQVKMFDAKTESKS